MKAYIRLTDKSAEYTPYETIINILKSKLSYGWEVVSAKKLQTALTIIS